MKYFPGDDIQTSVLDTAEYSKLCTARVRKVVQFVTSYKYDSAVIKAALSSIPRWRYVREMRTVPKSARPRRTIVDPVESDASSSSDDEKFKYVSVSTNLSGVVRAQKGLLDDTRSILKGKDHLVEFFLRREKEEVTMRLEVWRALMASAAYMGEKNLGFAGHHYRAIRGELDEWDYAHSVAESKLGCCSDSGCEQKIHFAFKNARGDENATVALEICLVLALQATKECHTAKGAQITSILKDYSPYVACWGSSAIWANDFKGAKSRHADLIFLYNRKRRWLMQQTTSLQAVIVENPQQRIIYTMAPSRAPKAVRLNDVLLYRRFSFLSSCGR